MNGTDLAAAPLLLLVAVVGLQAASAATLAPRLALWLALRRARLALRLARLALRLHSIQQYHRLLLLLLALLVLLQKCARRSVQRTPR